MSVTALRVLSLDDDRTDQMVLKRNLARVPELRVSIDEASDWPSARSLLMSEAYDVMFLDYRLQTTTGLEVLREVRGMGITTPVIMLTGQGDERVAVEVMHAGADDYIVKDDINPALLAVVLRSISEKRLQETRRKEAENRLELVVWGGDLAYFDWNLDTGAIVVNDRAATLVGIHPDEARGRVEEWFSRLIHPEDKERVKNQLTELASGSQPFIELEFRLRHREGRWVWCLLRARRDQRPGDGDATLGRILGILQDISSLKGTEERLRESEARLNAAIESLPFPLWMLGRDGVFVLQNSACERVFGNLVGRKPDEVAPSFTMLRAWESSIEQANAGHTAHGESEALVGDESRWFLDLANPVRNDGQIVGVLGINIDITDRKRAEEKRMELERQLWQSQRLESLGVLAGGIAHDFNNLLVAILGNAELAMADLPPGSTAQNSLDNIRSAVDRASRLTHQMLAYSGRGKFSVQVVDLNEAVQGMMGLMGSTISKLADLQTELAAGLPAIEVDPSHLQQVVMNVVTNASEALGQEPGTIWLRTGLIELTPELLRTNQLGGAPTPGDYVYLEVEDTGCGMDRETLSRLFEPFFSTKFVGRGLGMASVQGIVRGHRGALFVESAPGKGTRIQICFPKSHATLPERDHAPAVTQSLERPQRSTPLVLLVDDEALIRDLGTRILGRNGFEVITAQNGREAVELFSEDPDRYQCVILDLTMPEMDGRAAYEEMQRVRRDVPVVLCSGYDQKEVTERFSGLGVKAFLAKPYNATQLVSSVRRVIDSE